MDQINIFELIETESNDIESQDIESVSMERVAEYVSNLTGLIFKKCPDGRYKAKRQPYEFTLYKSHFSPEVYNGAAYISFDWCNRSELYGGGCPCDDIGFIVRTIKNKLSEVRND